MNKFRKQCTIVVAALAATSMLAACGSQTAEEDSSPGASPTQAGAGSSEPVTIEYWSGQVATDGPVAEWNAANPDIQVQWAASDGSWAEQAARLTAAIQAGNAPCLMLMQNDFLPSLVVSGALLDVTEHVQGYEQDYLESTWGLVTFAGSSFGVPAGTGPMAMYYRADLFEEYGVEVPTTWEEFADASRALTEAQPGTYLTGLAPDDPGGFVSLVAQRSDPWFAIQDDAWHVDVANADSQAVAEYWQGLLDEGLVNTTNRWDPTFYNDLSEGRQLVVIGGAWQAPLLASNVSGGAGSWAIAPIPTWQEGEAVSATHGGGSIVAIEGCEHPAEAMEFANWLTTNMDALVSLGSFPAMRTDSMTTPDEVREFFGGEEVYQWLVEYARTMAPWTWSPTWNEAQATLNDAMAAVVNETSTFSELLTDLHDQQVTSMSALGLSVTEP